MKTRQGQTFQSLWFDVERRYKTILAVFASNSTELWFDVERRYKTMLPASGMYP